MVERRPANSLIIALLYAKCLSLVQLLLLNMAHRCLQFSVLMVTFDCHYAPCKCQSFNLCQIELVYYFFIALLKYFLLICFRERNDNRMSARKKNKEVQLKLSSQICSVKIELKELFCFCFCLVWFVPTKPLNLSSNIYIMLLLRNLFLMYLFKCNKFKNIHSCKFLFFFFWIYTHLLAYINVNYPFKSLVFLYVSQNCIV